MKEWETEPGHYNDLMPGMPSNNPDAIYRTIGYVLDECIKLRSQLELLNAEET